MTEQTDPYEVVYYDATNWRWTFAARYDTRAAADTKADELRLAGYDARVLASGLEQETSR
jgi:hypothetical protein